LHFSGQQRPEMVGDGAPITWGNRKIRRPLADRRRADGRASDLGFCQAA